MNAWTFPALRRWLRAAARLIQFRSEVAIAVALAAGVAAGAVARHVVPANRSEAATPAAPADDPGQAAQHRQPPARPAGTRPAHPQSVDVR